MKLASWLIAIAAAMILASPASATLLYDSGAPVINACSPVCPELTTAPGQESFNLFANSTVTDIRFWTFESPGAYHGGILSWSVTLNGGPALAGGSFSLSQTLIGSVSIGGINLTEYQNDFSLTPKAGLSSGSYNLRLSDTGAKTDGFGIFWATSGTSALALQVTGAVNPVPEPAAAWLLMAGLGALAIARRHQNR